MPTFEKKVKVRFAHTDAAGIMFYPRYFAVVNDFVEDWFSDGIGVTYKDLHIDQKRAVPTAHIKADFFRPSFMDDRLIFQLQLTKIGTSSISLVITANCSEQPRLKVSLIMVYIDMLTGKSLEWPADLRAALNKWLPQEGESS